MPAAAVVPCDVCTRGPALGWILSAATTGATACRPTDESAAAITVCLRSCRGPSQLLPLVDSKSDELAQVRLLWIALLVFYHVVIWKR